MLGKNKIHSLEGPDKRKKLLLRFGKDRTREKGFVLLTTYVVVMVVTVFCYAFFERSTVFVQAVERNRNKTIAFNMAEAGVDLALARLAENPSYTGTNGVILVVQTGSGAYLDFMVIGQRRNKSQPGIILEEGDATFHIDECADNLESVVITIHVRLIISAEVLPRILSTKLLS